MMAFSVGYLAGLAAFVMAWAWVWYDRSLDTRSHAQAALADMALLGLGGLVTLGYVHDWRALLGAMLGGGIGTYMASRWMH